MKAPVNVTAALASFDEIYSPRIVARMNRLRRTWWRTPSGEHLWCTYTKTLTSSSWSLTASSM